MPVGTTFNLPNYTGTIYEINKPNAKFLSAIGGLNKIEPISNKIFEITTYELGSDDSNPANTEGQDAPASTVYGRSGIINVLEIFHQTVEVSYTKQGATQHLATQGIGGESNVENEMDWQVEQALKKLARRINYQFINGTFQNPSDNSQSRRTRGIIQAAAHVVDASGSALSSALIEELVKKIWDSGGLDDEETAVILCNSTQKIKLDRIYGKPEDSVTVGGVKLERIYTPLLTLAVMVDKHVPQDVLLILSLNKIKIKGLEIPGKGIVFEEPLAKTGASDRTQIYGELGLDHGPGEAHGKIINLDTSL